MTTVLLIEDDLDIRETLRLALEDAGYAVQEAEDSPDGVRALREAPHPLVVLVDHLLPTMTSEGLLRHMLDQPDQPNQATPARHAYAVITASPQLISEDYHAWLEARGIPTIPKPFDLEYLLATVSAQAARLNG